jgi:hypothetical protein
VIITKPSDGGWIEMRATAHNVLFIVAGLGLATPAASQDVSTTGPDFVARWKTLIGQTVQITGGRVYGARLDSALLSVAGGSILLSGPFDQDELRYLVEHCAAYRGGACELSVTGNVQPHFGNGPQLVNVKFQNPSPDGLRRHEVF